MTMQQQKRRFVSRAWQLDVQDACQKGLHAQPLGRLYEPHFSHVLHNSRAFERSPLHDAAVFERSGGSHDRGACN